MLDNHSPSIDPSQQGRWWTRLRRAFSIPDLVSDDAARVVIAHRVALQSTADHFDRMTVAKGLVWALLTLGEREELNDLFFDESDRRPLENINRPSSPEERIMRAAIDERGIHAPEPGTSAEWQNMVLYLCATLLDHVRDWPYEAPAAHYLPADR